MADPTDLTDLLGVTLPIIQAPMAGVQGPELAIAVCEAGALGSLPAAMLGPESLNDAIDAIRAGTDKPFNVNFFCHDVAPPDSLRELRWQRALARWYREYGLDTPTAAGPGRNPFDAAIADLLSANPVPVVSFHFGLPPAPLLERVRGTGAKILASATTVAEARWLEDNGADVVIAQGLEAGGHRGMFQSLDVTTQCGTFSLVPQIVAAVKVPVVAAGGIADGAGVAAALTLGAAGVQVGTSFLLCPEATTSSVHREALSSHNARHTALTNVFTGRPARSIVNTAVRELGPMSPDAPPFPLAAGAMAPLRAALEARGQSDFSPLWAGQNVSGCAELPAAMIVARLAEGLR
jgi:nitronate monooxygenase